MDVTFDTSGNYVYVKLSGQLSFEDIAGSFRNIVESSEYMKGMNRIWDLTEADLSMIDPAKVHKLTRLPEDYSSGIDDVKVALVSEKPINRGILHLFKEFSSDVSTTIETFRNVTEAIEWIKER